VNIWRYINFISIFDFEVASAAGRSLPRPPPLAPLLLLLLLVLCVGKVVVYN